MTAGQYQPKTHVMCARVKCLSRWSKCTPRGPPPENVPISRMQLGESINPMNILICTKQRKTPGQTEMKHNWPRPFVFYNNNKIIMILPLIIIMRNFYFPEPSFLMLITLCKVFSRLHIEILSLFSPENRFRYFKLPLQWRQIA